MAAPKLTPMLEQYLGIKEQNPDALLFFRMGDFYELFFEDAEVAARELQIALTSRNPNSENKTPMCGVPHHAVDAYVSQLLEKGYRIAICDQVEDPREAKGLVKRAVTRVLTPGTVVEDSNLAAKEYNYLAALFWSSSKNAGGLAWMDFSTGDWTGIYTKKESELWQWAQKINPKELLLAEEQKQPPGLFDGNGQVNKLATRAYFDFAGAKDKIFKAQSVTSLAVLDLEDKKELVQACGAILTYLNQTQKQSFEHLGLFAPLNLGKHLLLDEITERNLEIFQRLDGQRGRGTLIKVLDRTQTPMGGRLLQERLRHPWRELKQIQSTQDMVGYFFEQDQLRDSIRNALNNVYDLERLSTRVFLGRATPKDFIALRHSLKVLPELFSLLSDQEAQAAPAALKDVLNNWDNMDDSCQLMERALVDDPPPLITEGGLFRYGYNAELDEFIELAEHGEGKLKELLAKEQNEHNISKLKLGFNKVFGYFFELPKSQVDLVPHHYIRRQTLANCERYTLPELKELEERLVSAVDSRKNLEYSLFQALRDTIAQARSRFLYMAGVLAGLDYWQGLADAARRWGWVKPTMHAGSEIKITGGRHPVVEAVQGAANFIPNDLHLTEETHILLITGPNMAGKSTVLRQAAIICVMAQIGGYVPAKEAVLGLVDRVFSRVGASDNLAMGQSTFMVEMSETARILRQAGKRSLIILDEIGRGTSTFDGLALAWSVVEDLAKRSGGKLRTLFATHYHELTSLEGKISGIRNMNIAVKEWGGDIVFLRRLVPGPADRSYGIEVAKLAGVPRPVVQRAREILGELEQKAREANERMEMARAEMTMLPGLTLSPRANTENTDKAPVAEDHPLVKEMAKLDANQLSPLEALNLLHQWKSKWG